MEQEFLTCGIDQDEMVHGKEVAAALRKGKGGGIPWFVFFDPSMPVLSRGAETGSLKRRDAAVLGTADGPDGNVGCPISLEERSHFLACISAAQKNMSESQLLRLAELQRQFAADRDENEGQGILQLPKPQPSFGELQRAFEEDRNVNARQAKDNGGKQAKEKSEATFFPKFRALAKNYLAKPEDRGRSALWCLAQFPNSGLDWKNPGKVVTGLANSLVEEWANAPWALGLAGILAGLHGQDGFSAEPALCKLEALLHNPRAKESAGYQRVKIWQNLDSEKRAAAQKEFEKHYPDSRIQQ